MMPILTDIIHEIVPFDTNHAYSTALMRKNTKKCGLSLGDRACLSLAKFMNLPILTADKAWMKADLDIKIILIAVNLALMSNLNIWLPHCQRSL